MAKQKHCPYTSIGGQALIEGIMMKSPQKTALAVRQKDGGIDLSYFDDGFRKTVWNRVPVVRGVIAFVQSLVGGYRLMMLSADKSGYTEEEDEATGEVTKLGKGAMAGVTAVAGVLAAVLCVGLFLYLPRLAVAGLQRLFGPIQSRLLRSVIEQGIKLAVFIAYLAVIARMKDIRRVFSYHGAEHKTIFCYEAHLPLTVENVRRQARFHPRCGTSFMILMLLISIVFSTLVQLCFKTVYDNALVWTGVKLLMIPLICGVGYEVLKACGRHDNVLTRIVSAPGLWVQRLTTREPDDAMIEIAIAAMNAVVPENEGRPLSDFVPSDERQATRPIDPSDTTAKEEGSACSAPDNSAADETPNPATDERDA